jgi:hypothetical protein
VEISLQRRTLARCQVVTEVALKPSPGWLRRMVSPTGPPDVASGPQAGTWPWLSDPSWSPAGLDSPIQEKHQSRCGGENLHARIFQDALDSL